MAQTSHHRSVTLPQIWMPVCSPLLGQAASGEALRLVFGLAPASSASCRCFRLMLHPARGGLQSWPDCSSVLLLCVPVGLCLHMAEVLFHKHAGSSAAFSGESQSSVQPAASTLDLMATD